MRRSDVSGTAPVSSSAFAEQVHYYLSLTPRQLPSRYLYDDLGSALFESICQLPWYRITRTEKRLLQRYGAAILERVNALSRIVELGPGNGDKLAALILTLRAGEQPEVHLIDVSSAALGIAARTVRAARPTVVTGHHATYESGLGEVARDRRSPGRTLVLFLGSNIGNFDPPGADAFLMTIRGALNPGDGLLIGTDLVKPEAEMLLAYDDPLQVTAAFNRNMLVRMNRELGADFDIDAFAHRAVWNAPASRIEMHLVSRRRQRVRIPEASLDISFEAGETIWTESSYKYRRDEVTSLLNRAGFATAGQWMDDGFQLTLAEATTR